MIFPTPRLDKSIRLVCCLLLMLLFIPTTYADEKLKVVWLKWGAYGDPDRVDQGIIPDMVRTVFERAGYQVTFTFQPWPRVLLGVKSGKYDVVADLWDLPKYQQDFLFLDTLQIEKISLFVLKDSPLQSGAPQALNGLTIGGVMEGGYSDWWDQANHFKKLEVAQEIQMLRLLHAKRVDAIIGDPVVVNSLIQTEMPQLIGQLRELDPPASINRGAPAISRHHPQAQILKKRYHQAFKALRQEGLYEQMEIKHGLRLNCC
ncbi:substrate-binding periplasmic protein [Magnetococcus sp. PR-3]|uniref:substrate-binding periplasmic protein n=1 Tax=Magnetococcus sp. PR-3 TaxID=3120355 RepID=UPI002FCE0F11